MRIVIRIVAGLVAVVAIAFGIGLALPRTHSATSRVTLKRPPDEVWVVVRDLGGLLGTWSDLKSAKRLADQGGKEVWEQDVGGFPITLIIEESTPPSRMVTRVDAAPDAAFGGTWTYELTPSGSGAQVTVTEAGYVSNPLFRVMMKAMGVHRTADSYLKALGAKFGETVKPEHVSR